MTAHVVMIWEGKHDCLYQMSSLQWIIHNVCLEIVYLVEYENIFAERVEIRLKNKLNMTYK